VARRRVGSNQYKTRWGPDLPTPDRVLAASKEPPERRRCGEVWGTRCRAWVAPPDYTHGKRPSPEARLARARDPASPPQLLARLVGDPALGVRWEVARNRASPPRVLAALARDSEWQVREAVAGNPACPPELLQQLVRDPDWQVRRAARANPGCPLQWRALDQL